MNELVYIVTAIYRLCLRCRKYLLKKRNKRGVIACSFKKDAAIIKCVRIKL